MADPSFPSSSPLSSSSSISISSRPPPSRRRNTTQNNNHDVSATSSSVTGKTASGSTSRAGSYLPRLLVLTTVVSAFAAAAIVATGNGGSHRSKNNDSGNSNLRQMPPHLRRGLSEVFAPLNQSAIDALARLPEKSGAPSAQQPESAADDGTDVAEAETLLCDLDYCLNAFEGDLCSGTDEETTSLTSIVPLWVQILILVVLLSFSALFSGLTLGLMSLDITGLEIVMAGDDPDAAKYAETIYPLRKQGNLLLCTLLLGNVAVNSLMSIFSAEMFDGTIGFLSSTFLIVIFGEIIPQALVSSVQRRNGLCRKTSNH